MRIPTPCAVLGGAIMLLVAAGCQPLHNSHAPAIALGMTSSTAFARANHGMAINAHTSTADSLSVMTYNMQRTEDLEELQIVADHLEADLDRLPDFILCQEVMFSRSGRSAFGSSAEMLATRLGYYTSGSGRRSHREGLAVVSRYPFEHYDAKQLDARSLPLLGFPRVSVMGEFHVPGVGRVRVVNVHLTHNGYEHSLRERQLHETLEWVADRERRVPADVTILGGDFNALPDWRELDLVNDAPREIDFALMNFNGDEPTKRRGLQWKDRIDFIFLGAAGRDVQFVDERLLWRHGLPNASGRGTFQPSDHLIVHHEYVIGGTRVAGVR